MLPAGPSSRRCSAYADAKRIAMPMTQSDIQRRGFRTAARQLRVRLAELAQAPAPDPAAVESALDRLERLMSAGDGDDISSPFVLGAVLDARVALRPENRELLPERIRRVCDRLDRLAGGGEP